MSQQPQQGSGCGEEKPPDISDIESQKKLKPKVPLAEQEETDFLDIVNEAGTRPNRERKLPNKSPARQVSPCIDGRDDIAARNVPQVETNVDFAARHTPEGEENTGSGAQSMPHSSGSVAMNANKEMKEMTVTPSSVGGQSESGEGAQDSGVKVHDSVTYDGTENDTDTAQQNKVFANEKTTKATSPANLDSKDNKKQLDTVPPGNETTVDEGENMTDGDNVFSVMQSEEEVSCGVESTQKTGSNQSVCSAEGGKSMAVEAAMEEIYDNYDSIDLYITNLSTKSASCAKKERQGKCLSKEEIAEGEFSIEKARDDASERRNSKECPISAAIDNITTGLGCMSIDRSTGSSRKEENNGKTMKYGDLPVGDGYEKVPAAVNPGTIVTYDVSGSGASGVQPANAMMMAKSDGKYLQNIGSNSIKRQDSGEIYTGQDQTGCGKEKEVANRKDILFETKPPPPEQVEVRVQKSIEEESLINQLKLIPEVENKFPDVKFYTSVGQIHFVGNSKDAEAAALCLDKLVSSIHISKLQLRRPYIMMLRKDEVHEYINKVLMGENIMCYWKVTEDGETLVFGLSSTLGEQFKSVIHSKITFKEVNESRFSLTEAGLLKFSGKCMTWKADSSDTKTVLFYTQDIAEDIDDLFKENSRAEKEPYGIPDEKQKRSTERESTEATFGKPPEAGRSIDMSNKDLEYEHFALDFGMWKFMMQQENIQEWKSKCTISVAYDKGEVVMVGKNKTEVEKAVKDFKDMLTSVCIDYVVKPEHLSEKSEEWKFIEEEASKCNTLVNTRTVRHGPLQEKTHFRIGSTDICVGHGCIVDLKNTDIIMCSVNKCLYPITPMSELIFEKGGDLLKSEAIRLAQKRKHQVGNIIFSEVVGELPCSRVAYLVVGETYLEDSGLQNKVLSKITHIFDETIQRKKSCIAIQLEFSRTFPVRTSSGIVAEAIKQSEISKDPAVTNICLCVENIENLEPAKRIFRKKFEESSEGDFEMVDIFDGTGDETSAAVKVEVVTGSLVKQKVDAIVCIVGESLKLKYGGLSKEIDEKGGSEIQEELSRQPKPAYAEVVHTKGGKLKCKHVLFGVLPAMAENTEEYALKNLKLFLRRCFKAVEKLGCHSIAFPVLGTGRLNYPVLTVARELYRSAHYYAVASFVDLVKFVLYQDDQGLPEFEALHKRFQDLQRNLGCKEGQSKYFEVKISGFETAITVVQRVDHEALASDLIVKSTTLESTGKGGKSYDLKLEKPNKHVLNLDYYKMMFSPSPTDDDFKDLLKQVLHYIHQKGYDHITLDFSEGLEGHYDYITLTVDMLKSSFDLVESVQQIKIVSSEQMFEDLCKLQAASETANKTFASKVFARVWSGPSVTMFLKEHKNRPRDSWLAVLYSSNPQDLQHIKKKIEQYWKKENGSSVDKGSIFSAKDIPESSKLMEGARKSLKIDTETTKLSAPDVDRKAVGRMDSEPKQSLAENRLVTGNENPSEPDDEDDDESEAFGTVYAELHSKIGSEQQRNSIAENLTKSGTGDITVNTYDSKTYLTFNFSQRYEIQEQLIQAKTQGLFSISDSTEEELKKRTSDKLSKRVIENVDDKLFELFLLYVKEHHKGTQIKEDLIKRDGNNIHLLGDSDILDVVESKLKALRSWNTETVGFGEDMYKKAMEAEPKLKEDHPNVIVKLLENEIQITGPSEYTGPAKHKANIALGLIKPTGRKRRQFNEEYSSLPVQSLPKQHTESFSSTANQSSTEVPKLYQTAEGIVVQVYRGNITRLNVECIVNAANESLSHGGGVARAISDAAGSDFQRESDNYVNLHGQIRVTQCISTSAGALAYKHVLHAVGPRFSSSTDTTSLDELERTVFNALRLAEELKMKSVAFPSISAGIFGGQIDQCAGAYTKGVLRFSSQAAGSIIEEIHFVDVQETFVQKIQQTFDIAFTLMQSRHFASVKSRDQPKRDEKWDSSFTGRRLSKPENDFSSLQHHSGDLGTSLMSSEVEHVPFHETHLNSGRSQDDTKFLTRQKSEIAVSSPAAANKSFGSKLEDLDETRRSWPSSGVDQKNHSSIKPKDQQGRIGTTSDVSNTNKKNVDFSDRSEFVSVTGINIIVTKGDISMFPVDSVVCPEDINCSGVNGVARSIKTVLGVDTIWTDAKRRNPRPLSVLRMSLNPVILYKYVMLAFSPRWQHGMDRNKYAKDIRNVVSKVFEETKAGSICSIAFPVIGVGDDSTPFQLCCDVLCNEILQFAGDKRKSTHLKNIYIVCLREGNLKLCKDILEKHFAAGATERQHDSHNKNIRPVLSKPRKCSSCKRIAVFGVDICNRCSDLGIEKSNNHPYCVLSHELCKFSLRGFDKCDTIKVVYSIPSGEQRKGDPEPGKVYYSRSFTAYLPANDEGWQTFGLFKRAIDQGLVFKVAQDGFIYWSGHVEHKTSLIYGRYGYPDPNYLRRVREKLAGLGITPDTQPQKITRV